jgi:putative ABC transport system permease protein
MRALFSFQMAYNHVRASLWRVVLSLVSIALGVALVVAVQIMNAAVLGSFLDAMDSTIGRASFSIVAGNGSTFDEDVVAMVEHASGVRLVVPLVSSYAFPDEGTGAMLTVFGVDVTNDAAVRVYHEGRNEVVADTLEFVNHKDSIVLGREFAARKGWSAGSEVNLVTPSGVQRFTVRGLLDPEGIAKTLRGRIVVMDLLAAEAAFTAPGQINQIDVLAEPGRTDEALRAVTAMLPKGLHIERPTAQKELLRKGVAGFQAMLTAFSFLAVVAGFIICYSRFGAVFEARTWEIGLLRAVGLRRAVVFWELLKESLLLGAIGTAAGLPLGVLIGRYAFPAVARTQSLQFRMPIASAEPTLTAGAMVLGCAIGLGAAIIAAIVPAIRLARRQPIAALTHRDRELPAETRRWAVLSVLVLLAGLAIASGIYLKTGSAGVGNALGLLVALLVCAIPAPLLRVSSGAMERLARAVAGPNGALAARALGQNRRRAALTVASLGVGLGVVLLFAILGHSLERSMIEQLRWGYRAALVVSSPFVGGGYLTAPLSEDLVREVAGVEGVAAAAGWNRRDITLGDDDALLDGYDDAFFTNRRLREWPLERGALPGALEEVRRGTGALMTSSLARKTGIRVGDTLQLDCPKGPCSFVVGGITRSDAAAAVIISREQMKRGWNDDKVVWLFVDLTDPADPRRVAARIEKTVGSRFRVLVQSSEELIQYFASQVRQAFRIMYVMDAITLLLVAIGISDTLATTALDRTREFAMMRAVGLQRRHVLTQIVLEGLALGVLGILLASVLGVVLGLLWVVELFPAMTGWLPRLHLPYGFAAVTFVITVLICLVSSLGPAARAARLPVTAALRTE